MFEDYELGDGEFRRISTLAYEEARLNLHQGKKLLVQNRLRKRLRALGLPGFKEYLRFLEDNPEEVRTMVDCLTTNFTRLFREQEHFDFLREEVIPWLNASGFERIRFWSAGCSSGEEPYSLAIYLREYLEEVDDRDVLILATDISLRALSRAREGVYREDQLADVPAAWKFKYFRKCRLNGENCFRVTPELARLIRFRYLNLVGDWPMRGLFQVILCRNVMIYFDKATQQELVGRFHRYLVPGGYFFVGHSESLTRIRHPFRYCRPSVYRKAEEAEESRGLSRRGGNEVSGKARAAEKQGKEVPEE